MSYFARRIQLERFFGDKFKFQSAEFGEERPTMAEAVEAVEQAMKDYIKSKTKSKVDIDLNELPF
jgi:hypothetical protein